MSKRSEEYMRGYRAGYDAGRKGTIKKHYSLSHEKELCDMTKTLRAVERAATVIAVTCIACHKQQYIHENQYGSDDDYPCCNECGSPVVARRAAAQRRRKRA